MVIFIIFIFNLLSFMNAKITTDNICTFRVHGKLFSLTYLSTPEPYKIQHQDQIIYFNFCFAFKPIQCLHSPTAFSYLVKHPISQKQQNGQTIDWECQKYSSNSTISMFHTSFQQRENIGYLKIILLSEQVLQNKSFQNINKTQILIRCSQKKYFQIEDYQIHQDNKRLFIQGNSLYGCPVFENSNFWKVFYHNSILFGIAMVLIGFYLLFYGRSTIDITVFLAVLLFCLVGFGGALSLFISSNSSTILIYASFLLLLFVSCYIGYLATKLINVSIFFIGAFLGFIIGMLVSSIISKVFDIYSQWIIIGFIIGFSIPLGLLTFKYHDNIIIASSSFSGSYLLVRPLSWIIGGFPNQFLLYEKIESSQLRGLPWTFFIYLIFIIALGVVGCMYQKLKLRRQNQNQQYERNIITQNIEAPIDAVKAQVDKLINKFRSQHENKNSQQYHEIK